jgi:capsular polysaccharide export protein
MTTETWSAFRGKRVLLLQGPVGPFFWRLAKQLKSAGAVVHKVNFNGGDWLFYPRNAVAWRGSLEDWPERFESLLVTLSIEIVILFGDCRPIHRVARQIAHRRRVQVGAFEEGYVRPNFITFERFGVNGYSLIPRRPSFYESFPASTGVPERDVGNTFWYAASWATLYYLSSALLHLLYRKYRHHRPLTLSEAAPWIRSAWRKWLYRWQERRILRKLSSSLSRKFFLVPLQICTDSQISEHSRFRSVADFIRHVVISFAQHAPGDTVLAIKHHPLDRGYHDYGRLIRAFAERFDLQDRLVYMHDQHLPTLFEHVRGVVVINSTVGFSALTHAAPLKTLGVAIYDLEGLAFQGPLDEFWAATESFRPDMALFHRFRAYMVQKTQINGSFYRGQVDARVCASILSLPSAVAKRQPINSVETAGPAADPTRWPHDQNPQPGSRTHSTDAVLAARLPTAPATSGNVFNS